MALLDVSDVLLDPYFADSLLCERLTKTVSDGGIASETPKKFAFAGVVTNDAGDKLRRFAQGERVEGNIVVHSRFQLQEGDIVHFLGRRFTVMNAIDWSHFGRGFVAAHCDLIPLSG